MQQFSANRSAVRSVLVFFLGFAAWSTLAHGLGEQKYVRTSASQGDFVLSVNGEAAPLVVSDQDWPGVVRAVGDLSQDVGRVTGHNAPVAKNEVRGKDEVVLIGTIGKSPLIDELVRRKKLDVSGIAAGAGDCGLGQARDYLRDLRPLGTD